VLFRRFWPEWKQVVIFVQRETSYAGTGLIQDVLGGVQPIVDPVDGIADPACRMGTPFVPLGQYLVQKRLRIRRCADSTEGLLPADQIAELAIVIPLVFGDAIQDD
jgi:hypothetical protein